MILEMVFCISFVIGLDKKYKQAALPAGDKNSTCPLVIMSEI